ncbi:hypothetical protein DYH09_00655 [bacterium CPR1]|nr:hypothetical protein [bacterium CPR1]
MKLSIRIALLLLLVSLAARAALPPLSDEERLNTASDVIIGEVRAVEQKVEKIKLGTDIHYTAEVVVQEHLKGRLKPGDVIVVRFDRTGKRPPNWAGPQGQNEALTAGLRARLFMTEDVGFFRLLQPNGWDPAR